MKLSIVGGGFAGLAAARAAENRVDDVTLYDEGTYSGERRGPWGELVWDYGRIPLDREVPGYVREVEEGIFMSEDGETPVTVTDGVIIDRGELEKHWADTLEDTEIVEDCRIDEGAFRETAAESDLLIDATGPYPVSGAVHDVTHDHVCPTLSTRIEDDFSHLYPEPRAVSYKNYFMWIVMQSAEEATVGLGCSIDNDPEELYPDMERMLRDLNVRVPDFEALHVGNDVSNGLTGLSDCAYRLNGCTVHLAGDATGLVNRMTGFGLVHAAESGALAVDAFLRDRSYRSELVRRNLWRKVATAAGTSVQRRIGLDGIAEQVGDGPMEYGPFFEPEGPADVGRSLLRLV